MVHGWGDANWRRGDMFARDEIHHNRTEVTRFSDLLEEAMRSFWPEN